MGPKDRRRCRQGRTARQGTTQRCRSRDQHQERPATCLRPRPFTSKRPRICSSHVDHVVPTATREKVYGIVGRRSGVHGTSHTPRPHALRRQSNLSTHSPFIRTMHASSPTPFWLPGVPPQAVSTSPTMNTQAFLGSFIGPPSECVSNRLTWAGHRTTPTEPVAGRSRSSCPMCEFHFAASSAIPSFSAKAIVAPSGQRTMLTEDPDGYLASITNPASEQTTFSYYPGGLLKTEVNPVGATHTFHYDDQGRLIKDERPAGQSWSLSLNESGNKQDVTRVSAEGRTTIVEIADTGPLPAQSRKTTSSDAESVEQDSDPLGGTRLVTADGVVSTATMVPDPRFGVAAAYLGQLQVVTPAGIESVQSDVRSVTTDATTTALKTQTDVVTQNGRSTTVAFDASTRMTTTTSAEGRQTLVQRDDRGRTILIQDGDLAPLSVAYDERGRLSTVTAGTGSAQRTTTVSYDSLDRPISVTDPTTRMIGVGYDPANRVTSGPSGMARRRYYPRMIPPGTCRR